MENKSTRVMVVGANGKMGRAVIDAASVEPGIVITGGVTASGESGYYRGIEVVDSFEKCEHMKGQTDVVLDFSHPDAILNVLKFADSSKSAVVLGTSGYRGDQNELIENAARKLAVFKSGNFRVGLRDFIEAVGKFARNWTDDVCIEERCNAEDAGVGGTSMALAQKIINSRFEAQGIKGRVNTAPGSGLHRDGDVDIFLTREKCNFVSDHAVFFIKNDSETIFRDTIYSREPIARGALDVCRAMHGREPNGVYDLDKLGL